MKYGLLYHKPTQNLGDDIQSYAISCRIPRVDCLVDRENINTFTTEDGEAVATVMSAWWMWYKWNWPPSKYIYPFFTGFHYSDNVDAKQAGCPVGYDYLSGLGADYLNAYGPIYTRDYYTKDRLGDVGVNAEFGGCITITLPKQPETEEKGYIVLVDVNEKVETRIRRIAEEKHVEVKTVTHDLDWKNKLKSWDERKKQVEDVLTLYQNARCVVTRRLHCALPCLAMGVPVLLCMHTLKSIRFIPYYDWLYSCTPAQYLNGTIKYDVINPPENKTLHIEYRERIIDSIKGFVEHCESLTDTSAAALDKFGVSEKRINDWRIDMMKKTKAVWEAEFEKEREEIKELQKVCETHEKYEGLLKIQKREDDKFNKNMAKLEKLIEQPKKVSLRLKTKVKRVLKGYRPEGGYYEEVMEEYLRHMRVYYEYIKKLKDFAKQVEENK